MICHISHTRAYNISHISHTLVYEMCHISHTCVYLEKFRGYMGNYLEVPPWVICHISHKRYTWENFGAAYLAWSH